MLRALSATGPVITSAGIILAGTFSVLMTLPVTYTFDLGFMVALGILLDTFIVRSIMVPAAVELLGDRIWWPSTADRGGALRERARRRAAAGERAGRLLNRSHGLRHRRRSTVSDLAPDSPAESPPPRKPDPSGWRVDPAPDGRGSAPEAKPPMFPRSRLFIAILLGLLAVNLVISFVTRGPADRERVPVPAVLRRPGQGRQRQEISSQEDSIEGELKSEATYDPPGDAEPVTVTSFETEVPAFIDRAQLTRVLDRQNVVVNAEPPDTGRSLLGTLLLGFLPTILLVGFFVWLYAPPDGGRRGRRARRLRPLHRAAGRSPASRSESPSTTWPGSRRPRTSSSRSWTS